VREEFGLALVEIQELEEIIAFFLQSPLLLVVVDKVENIIQVAENKTEVLVEVLVEEQAEIEVDPLEQELVVKVIMEGLAHPVATVAELYLVVAVAELEALDQMQMVELLDLVEMDFLTL
jgi:hypothetical protein